MVDVVLQRDQLNLAVKRDYSRHCRADERQVHQLSDCIRDSTVWTHVAVGRGERDTPVDCRLETLVDITGSVVREDILACRP